MKIITTHSPHKGSSHTSQTFTPDQPEWIRLPRSREKCPYSHLSRSTLNNLILPCKANKNRPVVKSSVLRQEGATRGVRLIHRASLMEYIAANEQPTAVNETLATPSASPVALSQTDRRSQRIQTFSIAGKRRTSSAESFVGTVDAQPIFGKPGKLRPLTPGGSAFN